MSVPFYVYNTSSGEVLRTGLCPASMVALQATEAGEAAAQGTATGNVDTVNTGTGSLNPAPGTLVPAIITAVNTSFTANGVDTGVVLGLTPGTRAVWGDDVVDVVNDGFLEVRANYPGLFICELQLPGFIPRSVTFTGS